MNTEQILQRIFSLSRRAPPAPPGEMPYGFETAVFAHWREAMARRSTTLGLLRGLRWAALAACAVALLVGFLESDELAAFNNRYDPEGGVADSAIATGYDYE
ncbi:MAG: hypothetical protein ACREIF_06545 [Chthoniobacterales bacterium]